MRGSATFRMVLLPAWVLLVAIASGCGVLGPADARPGPASGHVTITSGARTGVYHAWSRELARQLRVGAPGLGVSVVESDGSVMNLRRVRDRSADIGLSTQDAAEGALHGAPLDGPDHLVAVARIYDDYLQIVVRADSGIRSVAQLEGRRVAVNRPGSGAALIAGRVLSVAGIDVRRSHLDLGGGMQALERGGVDAVIWSGGIPTPSITAVAGDVPLRLLPLGGLAARLHADFGSDYRPAAVPAGTYPGVPEVDALASPNLLVTRADLPAATVWAVLDTMFGRRDAMGRTVPAALGTDHRTAIWTGEMTLHPAAVSYYRAEKS